MLHFTLGTTFFKEDIYPDKGTRMVRSPERVSHREYLKELGVFSWRRTFREKTRLLPLRS